MNKFLQILKILGPAVLSLTPGAEKFAPLVIAGIDIAERTGKPGVEKRQIFLESVKLGAEAANTAANKEVAPVGEVVAVADNTVDAIVQAVNLVGTITDNVKSDDEE